ncbi:MAG: hypothetical protein IKZ50_02420 [Bacteroidales bacterium]|nr:hypothetical protein [Bacteroidales bacterium]
MEGAVIKKIRDRLVRGKTGEIFFVSSFPKYDVEYVTKLLPQFEKEGIISRLAKGIYVKARKTKYGTLYPSAYEIVKQLSKRDKAIVIPSGFEAANRLGFSTQVPMISCYLTTGSSRVLKLGPHTVMLKHAAPKNFAFKGELMPVLVQALRSIGEKNICEEDEETIRMLFDKTPENETFEHDLLLAPVWMRQVIKRNRNGVSDGKVA